MLLTAERFISARKSASANIAFTRSWQSSKLPATARLVTFGASTVVICRRCTGETRPSGCSIVMRARESPATAAIAALPVSPLVAPTMVMRWSRASSTWSNMRPRNCMATSLNASVGPWNSSRMKRRSSTCTSGATAGWPKSR